MRPILNLLLPAIPVIAGCTSMRAADTAAAPAQPMAASAVNPLLPDWTGPYGGVPPFEQVRVEHFTPALEAAMAENLAAVQRIASDPAAPDFENTIAALERADRTLNRMQTV
jgi:peptidyl-dipeptidase Dcp